MAIVSGIVLLCLELRVVEGRSGGWHAMVTNTPIFSRHASATTLVPRTVVPLMSFYLEGFTDISFYT